jgi:hypothetical protein
MIDEYMTRSDSMGVDFMVWCPICAPIPFLESINLRPGMIGWLSTLIRLMDQAMLLPICAGITIPTREENSRCYIT